MVSKEKKNWTIPYIFEKLFIYFYLQAFFVDFLLKLFEERKQLFTKWFETWNDSQRRIAIEEILVLSKPKQIIHTREILDKVSPIYHVDFTRILPRVICLYIMSFLDPRSLCRSSQVKKNLLLLL